MKPSSIAKALLRRVKAVSIPRLKKRLQAEDIRHWSRHMKKDIGMDYLAPLDRKNYPM